MEVSWYSYKDENPSKFFYFHYHPRGLEKKKTEAGVYAQISDCYVNMWYICTVTSGYCIAEHSLGALVYLKTKLSTVVSSR